MRENSLPHSWRFMAILMPFGLRNDPSIFQRVTQTVLAPFLWLFTLLYIDDIIVYSLTFKTHVLHVDLVLHAVCRHRLTLSPSKPFLGYQALRLLGLRFLDKGCLTRRKLIQSKIWPSPKMFMNYKYF